MSQALERIAESRRFTIFALVAISVLGLMLLRFAGMPRANRVALADQDFDSGNYELQWGAYGDQNHQFHLPHGADTASVVHYLADLSDGLGSDGIEIQLPEGWDITDGCVPNPIGAVTPDVEPIPIPGQFNQWHIESSPISIPWLATLLGLAADPPSLPSVFWFGTTPLVDEEPDVKAPKPPCNRFIVGFYPPLYPMGDLCDDSDLGEVGGFIPTCGNVVSPRISLYDIPTPITLSFANLLNKRPFIDVARVEISVNGSEWAILEDYTPFPTVLPVEEEIDLSDYAYSTVQFRWFFLNPNPFTSTQFFGWVIDNIEILGGMGTEEGGDPDNFGFKCPTTSSTNNAEPAPARVFSADTGNHRVTVSQYTHDGDAAPLPCVLNEGGSPEINWFGGFGDDGSHMNSPHDVVVGPDGYIYVADTGNHRILRFTQRGKPASHGGDYGGGADNAYGSYGVGAGDGGMPQFNSPKGIAAGGWNYETNPGVLSGFSVEHFYLYVADTGNHRIQRLAIDKDGQLVNSAWMEWGAYGDGDDQFHLPTGIDANPIHTPDVLLPPLLQLPGDSADWESRVYVADRGNHRVTVTDRDGATQSSEGWGKYGDDFDLGEPFLTELNSPEDVAVGVRMDGNASDALPLIDVYTADTGNHRVFYGHYEPDSGYDIGDNDLFAFGRYGDDDGQFNSPAGLAVDRLQPEGDDSVGIDGDLFVTDTGNHRGQRFGRPE